MSSPRPDSPGTRYAFAFAASYRVPALMLGITPRTTSVHLGADGLHVRFGLWRLSTPLTNIAGVERSGGFGWLKTAGPPHLSLSDRGVTFATNGDDAVCVSFHRPVAGIDPTRVIRHPGATLTVREPDRFVAQLTALLADQPDLDQPDLDQ